MRNDLRSVRVPANGGRLSDRKSMLRPLPFPCSRSVERTLLSGWESTTDAPLGGWEAVERWR